MSELKRYLKNTKANNRRRKGISPVIATVILVAVAVVIAAALAGFSGSLFGSYANGPQVKVQSMEIDSATDTGKVFLSNSGNAADTVTKITINGVSDPANVNGPSTITSANNGLVGANSNPTEVDFNINMLNNAALNVGQQVTAVISMQSGSTITQTITVS